jgi:hypothetical protein
MAVVVVIVMVVATGCDRGATTDTTSTTPAVSATSTTVDPGTVDPGSGEPVELAAHCGAVELPVAASPVLPTDPLDADASAALESVRDVAAGEAAFFDEYEWFVADRAPERLVLFGVSLRSLPPNVPPYADASFRREADAWVPDGWGQCRIEVEAPGFGNAAWVLDAEPDPQSAELFVTINERTCASGQPPVGRQVVPVVVAAADRVTITVLVEPVAGGADCPTNPWFPVVVDLGEPLGDRPLFDGSAIPPLERPWPPTPSSIDSFGSEA